MFYEPIFSGPESGQDSRSGRGRKSPSVERRGVKARRNISPLFPAVALLFGVGACVAPRGGAVASAPPEIIAMTPSSGPAGTAYPLKVTIIGRGFEPTGNTVTFGPIELMDLPSSDSQHLVFQAPKTVPSRGEVPPLVLPPGEYAVTVTTGAGTSRAMLFILTSRP